IAAAHRHRIRRAEHRGGFAHAARGLAALLFALPALWAFAHVGARSTGHAASACHACHARAATTTCSATAAPGHQQRAVARGARATTARSRHAADRAVTGDVAATATTRAARHGHVEHGDLATLAGEQAEGSAEHDAGEAAAHGSRLPATKRLLPAAVNESARVK